MAVTSKTTGRGTIDKTGSSKKRRAASSTILKKGAGHGSAKIAPVAKARAVATLKNRMIEKMLTVIERDGQALSASADKLLKRVF